MEKWGGGKCQKKDTKREKTKPDFCALESKRHDEGAVEKNTFLAHMTAKNRGEGKRSHGKLVPFWEESLVLVHKKWGHRT